MRSGARGLPVPVRLRLDSGACTLEGAVGSEAAMARALAGEAAVGYAARLRGVVGIADRLAPIGQHRP